MRMILVLIPEAVGCISPNPFWTADLDQQSNQIIRNIEHGLAEENLELPGYYLLAT